MMSEDERRETAGKLRAKIKKKFGKRQDFMYTFREKGGILAKQTKRTWGPRKRGVCREVTFVERGTNCSLDVLLPLKRRRA